MPYSAPLDGIRAIAILAVLIFHVSPEAFRGGFTGVDAFFVLSGFLITSNILAGMRSGKFTLREFYLRRVQRLLPNVLVTVGAVLLLWFLLMPSSWSRHAGRHGLWTIFNLSNVYVWRYLGGYWSEAADWAPLTHAWSLGVEEQFYLLFPAMLLVLAKVQPRRMGAWIWTLALASFSLYLLGTHYHPTSTFYLLPTRLWELMIGALLAEWLSPLEPAPRGTRQVPGPGRGELLGAVGLAMLLAGFLLIRNDNWAAGSLALVPTLGTLLILGSIQQGDTRLSRWLASPLLVGIGKRSYSLYLWHWPLITLGKSLADLNGKPELYGALAGGLAGVVLACGAYRFIEQPMRQRGPGRSRRLGWTAAMFVAVAAGSLAMAYRHPKTDPFHRFDAVLTSGQLYTAGRGPDFEMFSDSLAYCDVAFPPQPARPDDAWRTGGVLHLFGGGKPRVVVLGSSHALMNAHMIDSICKEQGISVAFLCMDSGTPAFFRTTPNYNLATLKEAEEFDQSRRNWLRQWHPSVVLVIDRWDLRTGAGQDFASDLKAFLAEVAPWTDRVLFMSQVPVLQGGDFFNLRELVTWRSGRSGPPPRLMPDQNEPLRQAATAMAEAAMASHPELRVLRADRPFYNPDGSVRYYSARSFFYTNTDHLADAGAEVNRAMVSQAIHAVLEDSDVARAGTGRLQIASASGAGGWH